MRFTIVIVIFFLAGCSSHSSRKENKKISEQNGIIRGTENHNHNSEKLGVMLHKPMLRHIFSVYSTENPCLVGEQTTYIGVVKNESNNSWTNIKLEVIYNDNIEFISASAPANSYHEKNKVTFAAYPILKSGEEIEYHLVYKAVKCKGKIDIWKNRVSASPESCGHCTFRFTLDQSQTIFLLKESVILFKDKHLFDQIK